MSLFRCKSLMKRKIESFSELEDNWDGYGGSKFSDSVLARSRDIISKLDYELDIFPTGRDSVQIECEDKEGNYIEFEIFEKQIRYLQVYNSEEHEGVIQEDEVNQKLISFFGLKSSN